MAGSSKDRHHLGRHRAAVLLWATVLFAVLQLAGALPEPWQVFEHDPAFADRFRRLQDCRAEIPGRPLVLFLGSSRVLLGIRPAAMRKAGDTAAPCVFNFAECGTGHLIHLLRLNRLLNRGIRPDILVVEVWPPYLGVHEEASARVRATEEFLEWSDFRLLHRHTGQDVSRRDWLKRRLLPFCYDRHTVQEQGSSWLTSEPSKPLAMDAAGWVWGEPVHDPRRREQLREFFRAVYEEGLRCWAPSPLLGGALRDTIALAQAHGSKVVLLWLPESTAMRGWYTPQVAAAAKSYLDDLSREYGVSWIDTHDWQPDEEFIDPVHLNAEGATAFSRRLGREVLRPYLENQPASRAASVGR